MAKIDVERQGYRSLFWPIILIGVGLIWLLGNFGIISGANLAVLFRLWPLALIVIGLDLLFGRQSPGLGALIGLGAVVVMVVLMLAGPSLGLVQSVESQVSTYDVEREGATSARVEINPSVGLVRVRALTDSNALMTADVRHLGDLNLTVSGTTNRIVNLSQASGVTQFSTNFLDGLFGGDENQLHWYINLNPEVRLDLRINSGVGESDIDLTGLLLTGVNINSGVGKTLLSLPAQDERYMATVNGGTGEIEVIVAEGAALDLNISSGVGNVIIDVPEGAAVRLESSGGIGSMSVPAWLTRVSGEDGGLREQGVWESADYAGAERQISIRYDSGVGGLTVR